MQREASSWGAGELQPLAAAPGRETIFKIHSGLPRKLEPLQQWFQKYTVVFGVPICATEKTSNAAVQHAAHVLAQYLDNDMDGQVDMPEVAEAMVEQQAFMAVFRNGAEYRKSGLKNASEVAKNDLEEPLRAHARWLYSELYEDEMAFGENAHRWDASWEEVLHLVSHLGWGTAFPMVWGSSSHSHVRRLLDGAVQDCGHAHKGTFKFPDCAGWFHYNARDCAFSCLVNEYVYWSFTTYLGAQSDRCEDEAAEERDAEWEICSQEQLQEWDPEMWSLITSDSRFPRRLPDGHYRPRPTDSGPGYVLRAKLASQGGQ